MKQSNIYLTDSNNDYIMEMKKEWNLTSKNDTLNKIIEKFKELNSKLKK